MKPEQKTTNLLLALGCLLILPLAARSETILYFDSFENDGTSYNEPNSSSTHPFNAPVAGGGGQTALTQIEPTSIGGQNGSYVLLVDTSGSGTDFPTDTITTKNGTTAQGSPGTFVANAEYTVSVLMAQPQFGGDGAPGNLFTGTLSLLDGTTGMTLDSVSHNFATGDQNFAKYSFSFYTGATSGVKAGDYIQLSLESAINTNSFQAIDFDALTVSAPEPGTYALLGLGLGLLVFTVRNRRPANS